MTGGTRLSPKHDKLPSKHRHSPVKGALHELAEIQFKDIIPSENDKSSTSKSEPQSSEILSTSDLISAVSYAWVRARQPLANLLSKSSSKYSTEVYHGSDVLQYNERNGTLCASTSVSDQSCSDYLTANKSSSRQDQSNLEYPQRSRNTSCPQHNYGILWSILHSRSSIYEVSSVQNSLSAKGFLCKLQGNYMWMNKVIRDKNQLIDIAIEGNATSGCDCDAGDTLVSVAGRCVPTDSMNSCNNLSVGIPSNWKKGQSVDVVEHNETDSDISTSKPDTESGISTSRSESDCENITLGCHADSRNVSFPLCSCDQESSMKEAMVGFPDQITLASRSESDCKNITLRCNADSHDSGLPLHSYDQESSMNEANIALPNNSGRQIPLAHVCESEFGLSVKDKPQYSPAKHEHAFAGAMAGIVVSLCLHPMDTIKTVIQSGRADHKPLHYVGRSIISERGLSGLYRGISSNIATSAPISAVYTFTYESVKKTMVPLLPKENHSFAYCTAGGCASIATSFIFTPSERIKQQMQVGSHYRNCWIAFKEVLQRGGLPSLYAGWTAVLCRNIPHSIIKFYTYERLKQFTFPSFQLNAQTNTVSTLICGGLAGSMASLFTTPFDVVKTRMQTQIPGSMVQYAGVFNTLTSIRKTEGMKGLYRGLSPRLVMYMIQGSLFFASYESFKSLFSLDVQLLNAQTIQPHKKT